MGWRVVLLSVAWNLLCFALYYHFDFAQLRMPFLPIGTIGTAVAFYVGFKNNAAYERFWEGRKIWGGIVNESRTWATNVLTYLPSSTEPGLARELIYRQLAWINALRLQLRRTTRFSDRPHPRTRKRLEDHAEHMRNDWEAELAPFLANAELQEVSAAVNSATQLLRLQGKRLGELYRSQQLDLFHQIELMHCVKELYTLQGQCERIKNTPFPRFYAEYSRWFTWVFLAMVPFGLLDVFADRITALHGVGMVAMVIVMAVTSGLVSWVFFVMESIGDASEDPFERSMNDVPMNALCRTIERDLRQMLQESDLPAPEEPVDGILY